MKRLKQLSIVSMFFIISFNSNSQEMKMYSEEWAPINFIKDGVKQGVSIDVLDLMLKKMGSKQSKNDIQFVPWSQGYHFISTKKNTMLFAMTRSDERESLFKWVCPITQNEIHVWSKSDANIVIKSDKDLNSYTYATVPKDASEQLIIKKGVSKRNLKRSQSYITNLKRLSEGKVQLVVDNIKGMKANAKAIGVPFSNFKSVKMLNKFDICYAFSKDVSDEVVEKYQKALDSVEADGSLKTLRNKYLKD